MTEQSESDVKTKRPNWTIICLVAVGSAIIFFLPYLGTICISVLMALLFYPIFKKTSKHLPEKIAAPITLTISLLIFFVPVVFIASIVIGQGLSLAHSLANASTASGSVLSQLSISITNNINSFLTLIGSNALLHNNAIVTFVHNVLPELIEHLVNTAVSFLSNLPKFFTSVIVYCFIFTALLRHGKSALNFIKSIGPFDENESEKYIEKSSLIVTASLRGQFIISVITAVCSAFLLIFLGLGNYFMLFVTIFTLLGMVPLGSGILFIPITIISMITGNFWPGFLVLMIYLLVVCNIDNIIRPHLISKKANLIPALVTLATFCGIYYFGILGIVYGPLIVILLTTTADIYISTRQQEIEKVQ